MPSSGEAIVLPFPKVPYKHTHNIMRIYNPQNQFGENLITSNAVEIIKNTILTGMGIDENYIASIGAETDPTKDLLTRISANETAISNLNTQKLGFEFVATLPESGQKKNVIYLVGESSGTGTERNTFSEYIAVFAGDSFSNWEKIGEVGIDTSTFTTEIANINAKIGEGFDDGTGENPAGTIATQLAAVKETADSALQGVSSTAVSGDATHGVSFTLTENATSHELEGTVAVTAATLTDGAFGSDDTKLTQAKDVQDAIATAITAEDGVVDAKTIEMESTSEDGMVKVAIAGTIGEHSIEVTTDDIASAATLSALDDYIKGDKVETTEGDGEDAVTTISGGIEKRLAAVEDSIGGGEEGIGARLDAEIEARQTDVDAILTGTKHAVGTVVVCSVTAKADTAGTFTVTKPTGVSSVHIMRVEWNHEDFVCKHNGEDIILWDSTTSTTGFTMPAASEIKVFALVTDTTALAEGETADNA